jgi:hypothetical protein
MSLGVTAIAFLLPKRARTGGEAWSAEPALA